MLKPTAPIGASPRLQRRRDAVIVGAALLVLTIALSPMALGEWQAALEALRAETGAGALLAMTLAYAVALALPFVPGVELGLLIMVCFGAPGVLVAYAATQLGLGMAFAAGRWLPARFVPTRLRALSSNDGPVASAAGTSPAQRGASRLVRGLLAYRYLALAVGLNLPANATVGGGGGLALLCGMSRQFGACRFALTVAIATSPLPLLMLASGFHLVVAAELLRGLGLPTR
jgi:hypothetical protein